MSRKKQEFSTFSMRERCIETTAKSAWLLKALSRKSAKMGEIDPKFRNSLSVWLRDWQRWSFMIFVIPVCGQTIPDLISFLKLAQILYLNLYRIYIDRWKRWKTTYDKDVTANVPAGKHKIRTQNDGPDWIIIRYCVWYYDHQVTKTSAFS